MKSTHTPKANDSAPSPGQAPRKPLLRNLLCARFDWMEARVVELAKSRGYFIASGAMNRMLSHLGSRPVGLSELARRVGTSRQAIHQLANEAAAAGVVEFVPSERDKRVKLLQYTEMGRNLAAQAAEDFELIERELAEIIGEDDLEELRRILAKPWSSDLPAEMSGRE